jgi:hypothetical protein
MQSGQAHDIDTILTHRTKGSMATRCPACPEIYFNLPEDFDIERDRDEYGTIYNGWSQ